MSLFSTGKEECRKSVILVTHSYMDLEVSFLCLVPFPLTSYAEPEISISLMFCILIHSLSCRVLALFPIFQKCFEVLYALMVSPTTHCLSLSFYGQSAILNQRTFIPSPENVWNGLYFYMLCNPLFFVLIPSHIYQTLPPIKT